MGRLSWSHLEVQEALGEGHSGVVYRARLRKAFGGFTEGTAVAVKRFKAWVMEEPGQLERIFGEIDVGRRVNHPNVVRVFGGVLDDTGRPALVMQYCSGRTLESLLRNREARANLSLEERFTILGQLAGGIAALHQHGIVHRDVKPANVILTSTGPMLADFGVVKSNTLPQETTAGAFLGTIRYAAPEYIFGHDSDQRLDGYSLGAIAFELLTGSELFSGEIHWARLIAAKAGNPGLSQAELRSIPTEYGWNVASLIHFILAHSLCGAPKRDLDLTSLSTALLQHVWTGPFATEHGHIRAGDQIFKGSYASAASAAAAMKRHLSVEDRRMIVRLLQRGFFDTWIYVREGLREKRVHRWVVHHFADHPHGKDVVRFMPVVREAFVRGLIELGNSETDTDSERGAGLG